MQRRFIFALSSIALTVAAGTAFAQGYPNKVIKLQVDAESRSTTQPGA